METLETVFGVGRESVGVSFGTEFESCAGEFPADDVTDGDV